MSAQVQLKLQYAADSGSCFVTVARKNLTINAVVDSKDRTEFLLVSPTLSLSWDQLDTMRAFLQKMEEENFG